MLNRQLVLVCGRLSLSWEHLQVAVQQTLKTVEVGDGPSKLALDRFGKLQQARQPRCPVADRSIIKEALNFK